ncbi:MAG: histidine--tRNA ligase [bacterium]|nr:MAG: histidine--tRNA ligase [bacterium]
MKAIRGFSDVPPEEAWKYNYIEELAREHFQKYGYREVRLPVVEATELFARGIGTATDIVEKEMYTFLDRNGQSLTLRPEGTASAVRAYLEGGWKSWGGIAKIFYTGPMFRYERPQKGRYRQFYQMGLEAIGAGHPEVDGEVVALLHRLFLRLGVEDITILINSLGCPVCRPSYRSELVGFLQDLAEELCSNCRKRIEKNPLRILDCKVPTCRENLSDVPVMIDHLCGECSHHFERVRYCLDGLDVPYAIDPKIVRGLDYYNRTAFEAICGRLGSQNAVAAGGRYDGLAREIGGDVPGIGFAMGIERLRLVMEWKGLHIPLPEFYVASATENARLTAMTIADKLRSMGSRVETDLETRSLKAQLRSANRMNIRTVVIVGDDEIAKGTVICKDFSNNTQQEIPLDELFSKTAAVNRR